MANGNLSSSEINLPEWTATMDKIPQMTMLSEATATRVHENDFYDI